MYGLSPTCLSGRHNCTSEAGVPGAIRGGRRDGACPPSPDSSQREQSGTPLDLDLGHLERAQGDVGEELGGGGTSEPDGTLVLGGVLLTSEVAVGILEHFVETVLEHSLEGVADESGAEAFPETAATFLGGESPETRDETLVLARVHL